MTISPIEEPARPMLPRRFVLLLLPLLAAACSSAPPPVEIRPLRYDYLTPLPLNVGEIEIDDSWRPHEPGDVGARSPVTPLQALAQMGRDRLKPAGSTARAVFIVDDASLVLNGEQLLGSFAVHVEIIEGDGKPMGYAEARVIRTRNIAIGDREMPGELYTVTRQMMDAMNIEFEFQVRHKLLPWLVTDAPKGTAAPVDQQTLPAPGSEPDAGAPAAPPTLAPPTLAPPTLAPPTLAAPQPMPAPVPMPPASDMSPPPGFLMPPPVPR